MPSFSAVSCKSTALKNIRLTKRHRSYEDTDSTGITMTSGDNFCFCRLRRRREQTRCKDPHIESVGAQESQRKRWTRSYLKIVPCVDSNWLLESLFFTIWWIYLLYRCITCIAQIMYSLLALDWKDNITMIIYLCEWIFCKITATMSINIFASTNSLSFFST